MGALCGGRQAVRCADQRASTPGSNGRRAQIRKRSLPVLGRHLLNGGRPSTPAEPQNGTQALQPSQSRPLTSDRPLPESAWPDPFTSDGWLLAQLHRPHTSGARPAFSHTRTSHPPRPLTSHGCPIAENSSELADSSRLKVPDLPISIFPAASDDDWASNVLAALSSHPNSGRSSLPNSGRSSGRKKKPVKTWRERLPTYWIGCSSLPVTQKPVLCDVIPDVIPDVGEIIGWRKLGAQASSEVLLPQMKNAFRCLGPYEVQCEDLPTALQHMGFYVVDNKAVEKITKTISTYSTLNFEEFMRLADGYAAHDWAKFQTTVKEHDDDGTGQLCFNRVLEVMASQGIMPLRSTLDEMLGRLDRDKSGRFDIMEVAHLMASFRATEGFSSREVDSVYQIFKSLASSGGVSNSSPAMKATELLPGLLQVFGLHCACHAKKLVEVFVAKTDMCALFEFRCFLALARRLREIEVNDYRVAFNLADHDGDGRLSPAEASDVLPHFGYTPLRVVVDEVLTETGLSWDQPLDFENFVCFSRVIRHRDGFLEGELEEYVKLFNQFDVDNSNAVDGHELRKIRRQLGHQVSLSEVRALLKAVDGNSDGVLTFEELLQLLRLHRESELKRASNAFSQRSKNNYIETAELKPTLALLGHNPTNATFEYILTSVESRASWSFDDFVGVLDKCRKACAEESHKRAGWSDSEFEFLCQRFKKCCGKVEGTLTKGELLWILMDLGITIKTSAARNNIVSKVPEARTLALKAGVNEKDAVAHGDSTVTVWVLAHLLRLLSRGGEEETEDREILAREDTKFSHAEIVEFSEVFAKLVNESNAECDSSGPSHDQRQNSTPASEVGQTCLSARPMQTLLVPPTTSKVQSEAEDAILRSLSGTQLDVPKLPISALRELLISFGAKVSLEQNQLLRNKVLEFSEGQGQLDFSDFLRVMRWMLDTNFAEINAKAKEVAGQTAGVLQKSLGGA